MSTSDDSPPVDPGSGDESTAFGEGMDFRMDFDVEVVDNGLPGGPMTLAFIPSPDRYEWVNDEEEGRLLWDKLDRLFIPEHVMEQMAANMSGQPIGFEPSLLGDAREYASVRRRALRVRLRHEPTPVPEGNYILAEPAPASAATPARRPLADPSEEFLASLPVGGEHGFVILSVDTVGSTKLSQLMSPQQFAAVMSVVADELSEVVPYYHGHVLKYTGDGLIAYFPEPSLIVKNDLALECAIVMQFVMREVVNPMLTKAGLRAPDMRIGMDSGRAIVTVLGSPATKRHTDLIGDVINLATKVEKSAEHGGIAVGETMERHLHTSWRRCCLPQDPPRGWPYTGIDGEPYRVAAVGPEATRLVVGAPPPARPRPNRRQRRRRRR